MKTMRFFVILACLLLVANVFAQLPDAKIKITCKDVTVAGATETDTYAIADNKAIAGDYIDSSGVQHGMILKGKKVTKFDGPTGSTFIAAYGINSANVVVGWYYDSSGIPESFAYAKGSFSSVAFPGAVYTEANGINDHGWIVGQFEDTSGVFHGFYWDTTNYHQVDIPGSSWTNVWAINNSNVMTAYDEDTSTGYPIDGYIYDGTTWTKMDPPNSSGGVAIHGINNKGDLDFTIFDSSDNRHGVLYQAATGVYTQFDDPKGVNGTRADGINDSDMMVGRYTPSGSSSSYGFQCTVKMK
jgi:hypothetical protein